jgi:hypothetical protein
MHREGFVVQFQIEDGRTWVGNFQPTLSNFCDVLMDEAAAEALVIAGGQGYRVRLDDGELLGLVGGGIKSVYKPEGRDGFVLCNGTDFELYRRGVVWCTRRISWDGVRNIAITGTTLVGEAWMFDDSWHSFSVDLETGEAQGGSYYEA